MSNIIKKGIAVLKSPKKRTIILAQHGFFKNMSDEEFLKMQFKNVFGYPLDLNSPKTYSEKLQWLKLYDRKPEYTMMVDKYEVKQYVALVMLRLPWATSTSMNIWQRMVVVSVVNRVDTSSSASMPVPAMVF